MKAGSYEWPITILKHQITISEFGDQQDDYVAGQSTRAFIAPNGGQRTDANDEVQYIYRKSITVRSYLDVNEFDRVELNNKQYRILSIDKDRIKNQQTLIIEQVHD